MHTGSKFKIFIYKLRITENKQETGAEKLQEFYKIGVLAGTKERRFCFLIWRILEKQLWWVGSTMVESGQAGELNIGVFPEMNSWWGR